MLQKMELSLSKFYTFGMWCMIVIASANTWGLVLKIMADYPLWALIVAVGGIALNCMFACLFWYLGKQQQPQNQQVPQELKEAENLKELFKNG